MQQPCIKSLCFSGCTTHIIFFVPVFCPVVIHILLPPTWQDLKCTFRVSGAGLHGDLNGRRHVCFSCNSTPLLCNSGTYVGLLEYVMSTCTTTMRGCGGMHYLAIHKSGWTWIAMRSQFYSLTQVCQSVNGILGMWLAWWNQTKRGIGNECTATTVAVYTFSYQFCDLWGKGSWKSFYKAKNHLFFFGSVCGRRWRCGRGRRRGRWCSLW